MEEPHEMVDDNQDARSNEGGGGEGDEGPARGEILEVDSVA
jgi:hypothetical protein